MNTNDYNWHEAFNFATNIRSAYMCSKDSFSIEQVVEVIRESEGENDGPSWMMVGRLSDGRYFFLDAWCDYTGWDCQSGGDAQVASTLNGLIRYGMTEAARERLNLKLDDYII